MPKITRAILVKDMECRNIRRERITRQHSLVQQAIEQVFGQSLGSRPFFAFLASALEICFVIHIRVAWRRTLEGASSPRFTFILLLRFVGLLCSCVTDRVI